MSTAATFQIVDIQMATISISPPRSRTNPFVWDVVVSPALGRWMNIDPKAELYRRWSPPAPARILSREMLMIVKNLKTRRDYK